MARKDVPDFVDAELAIELLGDRRRLVARHVDLEFAPTQEQVEKFRQNLIGKMTSFPRAWIEQRYDPARARPTSASG